MTRDASNVIALRPAIPHDIRTAETTIRAPVTTGRKPSSTTREGPNAPELSSRGREPHTDLSCVRANAKLSKTEFQALVKRLSATELTKRFSLDYSSFKDMKGRRKNGCEIAPEFRVFRSFLRHMGVPRPNAEWTLDRIDPFRKEYGPNLCRWAPRDLQANNRTDTIYLTGSDGRTLPLTDWAALTGQDPKKLRKRRERHPEWSDVEVIAGRQGSKPSEPAAEATPIPAPSAASSPLDRWPAGVTVAMWETGYGAFVAQFGSHRLPGVTRPVFFTWIIGNRLGRTIDRLAQRYPGFYEPDTVEPSAVREDPEYPVIATYKALLDEVRRDIYADDLQYNALRGLHLHWPNVDDPLRAAQATKPRDNYD